MLPCADAVPDVAATVVSPMHTAKTTASTPVLSRFNFPSTIRTEQSPTDAWERVRRSCYPTSLWPIPIDVRRLLSLILFDMGGTPQTVRAGGKPSVSREGASHAIGSGLVLNKHVCFNVQTLAGATTKRPSRMRETLCRLAALGRCLPGCLLARSGFRGRRTANFR